MRPPRKSNLVTSAVCALLLTLTPGAATLAEPTNLTPKQDVVWKDFLGINAHFLWFSPRDYRTQIRNYKKLGLEWVRVDLHWDKLEPQENQYRWDLVDPLIKEFGAKGIKSVFYLVGSAPFATSAPEESKTPDQYPPSDPTVFADRMAVLSQRYPEVDAWQVWNEPNLPSFWRPHEDPDAYNQLLRVTTETIRSTSPGKTVVTAGMAYYSQMPVVGGLMLESLLHNRLAELDTVVAYHPYSEQPEGEQPAGSLDLIPAVNQINNALRSSGVEKIWATEWGWSSYDGPKELQALIGEKGQADFTLRRLALMSALDFDRIFLFALSDLDQRASARDQHYGLLDINGNPKPVYDALRYFLEVSGESLTPGTVPEISNTPRDFYSVNWKRSDGKNLMLFWSDSGGNISLPGVHKAELYNPLEQSSASLRHKDGIQLVATSTLQMLVW